MYACFDTIPQDVRQRAFDLYMQKSIESGHKKRPRSAITLPSMFGASARNYCPWGAINYILYEDKPLLLGVAKEEFLSLHMPSGAPEERDILRLVGLDADESSAENFIEDSDNEEFRSFEELADAMGVTYNASDSVAS
jgi:hypothetical protein